MEIIRKDQVYFADKDRHSGVFELFNLTDFPVRTNDNIRKAYLRKHCPAYVKGDGIPKLEDNDVRSQWLYQCGKTFTTVQEAIEFLESL